MIGAVYRDGQRPDYAGMGRLIRRLADILVALFLRNLFLSFIRMEICADRAEVVP